MSLTCTMSRWLIPGEAAVIHAAHSGLSATKDNRQNKAGESAAGGRKPSSLSSASPSQLFDWRIPPRITFACLKAELHSAGGEWGVQEAVLAP